MAILKCKMCGGSLEVVENATIIECEYCGSVQTLPKLDDEKKLDLFDRANYYRTNNEFDKASIVYENIINEEPNEAEAHWGICLCRYGIEYVEDPKTKKRIPTCHRTQFKSILEDNDYLSTIENADILAKEVYQNEAQYIDFIQKGILEISSKEEPYDVFICYKETDAFGERTIDSVIAQEIYDELTENGYRTFFSKITLEDKIGQAYEPYIFSALNSAKVMLIVGTKAEHFNAVWVKNEWSRFMSFIEQGHKKAIVPCYRDISPYDLPNEFVSLQSQDVSKIGWKQDLLRGISKLISERNTKKEFVSESKSSISPLMERAMMYIEDGNWQDATTYFNRVLDEEPTFALAYVGLLMAEKHLKNRNDIANLGENLDNNVHYQKAVRFAEDNLKEELEEYNRLILERNEEANKKGIYSRALTLMSSALSKDDFSKAAKMFEEIIDFSDSRELYEKCCNEWQIRFNTARETIEILQSKNELKLSNSSLSKSISDINSNINKLKNQIDIRNSCMYEIEKLETEKEKKKKELNSIIEQKKELGVFSFKRKREYDEQTQKIELALSNIDKKINDQKMQLQRIRLEDEINDTISNEEKKLAELTVQQKETSIQAKDIDDKYNEAKGRLVNEKILYVIMQEPSLRIYLAKDRDILIYILQSQQINKAEIFVPFFNDKNVITTIGNYIPFYRALVANPKVLNVVPSKLKIKAQIQASSRIMLGAYPQNDRNAQQPIEWEILHKEPGKFAFLISKYCIDHQPFHNHRGDYTVLWERSIIRSWLNRDFYNIAFSSSEKQLIMTSTQTNAVPPNQSPRYRVPEGNATSDKVFLLSYDEAVSFLGNRLTAYPTNYVKSLGASLHSSNGSVAWWLRTPSTGVACQSMVWDKIYTHGHFVDEPLGVRPVILVDLSE